ncbi:MAG: hypothetical protein AMXMBFR16_11490 [Candidatus Uhrbacteria bacterium]
MKLTEVIVKVRTAERELQDASRKLLILETLRDVLSVPNNDYLVASRNLVVETLEGALTSDRERNVSKACIALFDLSTIAGKLGDDNASEHYRNIARRLACR